MTTSTVLNQLRPYGFGVTVSLPYDQAVERIIAELKEQGFGVLTQIDVKATLKTKLDVEFRPYVILGVCNPPLAHRALTADVGIGLLLPCNVIVYENDDGTSTVEAMDPEAALGLVGPDADIADVAHDAKQRLQNALAAVVSVRRSDA
jgi:uncharacterized protein (DUF302 family)